MFAHVGLVISDMVLPPVAACFGVSDNAISESSLKDGAQIGLQLSTGWQGGLVGLAAICLVLCDQDKSAVLAKLFRGATHKGVHSAGSLGGRDADMLATLTLGQAGHFRDQTFQISDPSLHSQDFRAFVLLGWGFWGSLGTVPHDKLRKQLVHGRQRGGHIGRTGTWRGVVGVSGVAHGGLLLGLKNLFRRAAASESLGVLLPILTRGIVCVKGCAVVGDTVST
jgi:hypothetical protein